MTITISTVVSNIKRHLSIIGKRLHGRDGKNMFSDITVSSAEEPIFQQYVMAAAQNVEALLRQLITSYSQTADSITIEMENSRGSTQFDGRCSELITSYMTFFSVGEYLAMTHPDLAAKYQKAADNTIQSLTAYAFSKKPPVDNASFTNPTGTIANN